MTETMKAADVVRILEKHKIKAHVKGARNKKEGIPVENNHDHNVLIHIKDEKKIQKVLRVLEKALKKTKFKTEYEKGEYIVQDRGKGTLRVIKMSRNYRGEMKW